jgi:hypothetical protein
MILSTSRVYSISDGMKNEWVAVGGMRIGKECKCIWRKLAPVPFCPPHIPNDYK